MSAQVMIAWSDAEVDPVVERWESIVPGGDRMTLVMDLLAADGVNGNPPLDYEALLGFEDFSFAHDVGGIIRHMNRETGKLEGFFVPRCAVKS